MGKLLVAVAAVMVLSLMSALPTYAAEIHPCDGAVIGMGGTRSTFYEDETPVNNASYDGFRFRSTAPYARNHDHAIKLGGKTVVAKLCIGGPIVDGSFPYTLTWRQMHEYGGYGLQLFSKLITATKLRIDNVEDGIKMQNCTEDASGGDSFCNALKPGGRWRVSHLYMTGIRDDSIDNDDCMPGDVVDSLFDGVHTFLSEQKERNSTGNCVSSGEDTTIGITRTIVKLQQNNAFDPSQDGHPGAGKWFKWQGGTPHHRLVITNTILAVEKQPRRGWDSLDMPGTNGTPGSVTWVANSGNMILYLGNDTYRGPRPAGVAFKTGAAARSTYTKARNRWLRRHNIPTLGSDINSKDDPVTRVGPADT